MIKMNKEYFKKGFSLIELMVAVAILAFVIFGIFHAYSVGFMGMADAKDRTVATNYLRKAMEDVKNMDFEKIATTTMSVIDGNRKYRIDVTLIEESETFKKIHTLVSWKDRNAAIKTVDGSLTINFTEVFASDAAKIVLFADSYSILNDTSSPDSFTEIIAVIKDINGNTVTDWEEGDVTFEIISSEPLFGEFPGGSSITDVPPVEGRASITFSSKGTFTAAAAPTDDYYVLQEIKASVYLPDADKSVTDIITIKITDGPVKIRINDPKPNPESLEAGIGNYSTITASVINAAGDVLLIKDIFNTIEITFNAFGEGKFENDSSTYTYTIEWDTGNNNPATFTVDLYSTGNAGSVNIVASSPNLESDSTSVVFVGEPVAISISAQPNSIYVDDTVGSVIRVGLLDSNGNATKPTTSSIIVSLTLSDNGTGGSIVGTSLTFDISDPIGVIKTSTFSGQTSNGTAIIDASATGLAGASVTINVFSSLIADHIKLTPSSQYVEANGSDSATIFAIVYDDSGKQVTTFTDTITFNVTYPDGNIESISVNAIGGSASITITSSTSGNAFVTVSTSPDLPSPPDPEEGVKVGFYDTTAGYIKIEAIPSSNVKADGIEYSWIKATVCDSNHIYISDYEGTITFNITTPGIGFFIGGDSIDTTNGIAEIKLYSDGAGTSQVIASVDSIFSDPCAVSFYLEPDLEFINGSAKYYSALLEVDFDVKAIGENILLDEMGISWNDPVATERFQEIFIDTESIYTGNNLSGTIVDVTDTNLIVGTTYTIKIIFAKDVEGKTFDVEFFPYIDSYLIEGITPITQ